MPQKHGMIIDLDEMKSYNQVNLKEVSWMKTRKYAIITGIIILLMCLSGCKSNKYDKSGVKVVFELEGGTYQNSTLPVVYY